MRYTLWVAGFGDEDVQVSEAATVSELVDHAKVAELNRWYITDEETLDVVAEEQISDL